VACWSDIGSSLREGHRARAMFSLFYGLWKYVFTKDEFRVLMLGVDKAGKTVISLSLSFLITRIQ
jgi:hypothetical protein